MTIQGQKLKKSTSSQKMITQGLFDLKMPYFDLLPRIGIKKIHSVHSLWRLFSQ